MSTRQHSGGRIHPHQRNANFDGELLGHNIVLDESHIEEVQAIEQFSINTATKKIIETESRIFTITGSGFFQIILASA